MRELSTVAEVIDALGGPKIVASKYSKSGKLNTVSTWKTRGFPARRYIAMNAELRAMGLKAPASLWRMAETA